MAVIDTHRELWYVRHYEEGNRMEYNVELNLRLALGDMFDEAEARQVFEKVLAEMKKVEELGRDKLAANLSEIDQLIRWSLLSADNEEPA
jgi:hypothetical protein